MKVALLLSGHVRRYLERYNSLRSNLLDVLNPDIFIHTWNNVGLQNPGVNRMRVKNPSGTWIDYRSKFNDIDRIIKLYDPKGLQIQSDTDLIKSFSIDDREVCIFIGQARDNATKYINSQLYSIYKSNELKKRYEEINGFKYDIVIRLRFDFEIYKKISIDILDQDYDNKIYIAHPTNSHHGHHMGGGGCCECQKEVNLNIPRNHVNHSNDICDILAYGSSQSMDDYCSIFPNAWDIYSKAAVNNNNNISKMKIKTERVGNLTYVHGWDAIEKHVACYYPERLLRHWLQSKTLINDNYFYGRIIR